MNMRALTWAWDRHGGGQEGKLALLFLANALPEGESSAEVTRGGIADFALVAEAEVSRVLATLSQSGLLADWEDREGRISYRLPIAS